MKQVVIFNYQQLRIVELQYQMRSEDWNESCQFWSALVQKEPKKGPENVKPIFHQVFLFALGQTT